VLARDARVDGDGAAAVDGPADRESASRLNNALWPESHRDFIMPFAGGLWLRLSAQAYNKPKTTRRSPRALPRRCAPRHRHDHPA
jgi:hypothetical protein